MKHLISVGVLLFAGLSIYSLITRESTQEQLREYAVDMVTRHGEGPPMDYNDEYEQELVDLLTEQQQEETERDLIRLEEEILRQRIERELKRVDDKLKKELEG